MVEFSIQIRGKTWSGSPDEGWSQWETVPDEEVALARRDAFAAESETQDFRVVKRTITEEVLP